MGGPVTGKCFWEDMLKTRLSGNEASEDRHILEVCLHLFSIVSKLLTISKMAPVFLSCVFS